MPHHIVEMFESFHAALREQVAATPEDKAVRDMDHVLNTALHGENAAHITDHAAYAEVVKDIRGKYEALRAALQARTDETLAVKALMAFEPVLSEIRQLGFAHEAKHAAPVAAAPAADAAHYEGHEAATPAGTHHETVAPSEPHHTETAAEAHAAPEHDEMAAAVHPDAAPAALLAEAHDHAEAAAAEVHQHADIAAAAAHDHANAAMAFAEHASDATVAHAGHAAADAAAHIEHAAEAHAPVIHAASNGAGHAHAEVAHLEQTFPHDDALAKRIAELEAELARARAKLAQ